MDKTEIISHFKSTGAFLDGHFLLTSGRHSNKYFEKFTLLSNPDVVDKLCKPIYSMYKHKKIDVVLGAATGGIILAYELGKQFNTKGFFAERVNGELKFRRGFTLRKDQKVLLVDDVVTTGGSVFELINLTKTTGANISGIAVMFDRANGEIDFGYPFFALHSEKIESWDQGECPQCMALIPLTKRGSTGKQKTI